MKYFPLLFVFIVSCSNGSGGGKNKDDAKLTDEELFPAIVNKTFFAEEVFEEDLLPNKERITSCKTEPLMPAGFQLSDQCEVKAFSFPRKKEAFKLLVTDDQQSTYEIELNLKINIKIPEIPEQTFYIDEVTVFDFIDDRYGKLDCQSEPPLPAGFTMDSNFGCQLQGTPDIELKSENYNISIKTQDEAEGNVILGFKVVPPRPTLSGLTDIKLCTNAIAPAEVTFENKGAAITDCKVIPELPEGLFVTPANCTIFGKTLETFLPTTHVLQAHSDRHMSETQLNISSDHCETPKLVANMERDRFQFYQGLKSQDLTFNNISSVGIAGCTIHPPLPKGLNIDPKSCKISGTPEEISPLTNYSITARGTNQKIDALPVRLEVKGSFISIWKIAKKDGQDPHYSIKLPLVKTGQYDFVVDWGDGSAPERITSYNQKEATHTYEVFGRFRITIKGLFAGFQYFYSAGAELIEIKSFGALQVIDPLFPEGRFDSGRRGGVFGNAELLDITATDSLDVHRANRLDYMFYNTKYLNSVVEMDTRHIISMNSMFEKAESIAKGWPLNTTKVISMQNMFKDAKNLQVVQPMQTDNVKDYSGMFAGTKALEQIIPLNFSQVTRNDEIEDFFKSADGFSTKTIDEFLINLSEQTLHNGITLTLPAAGRSSASDEAVKKLEKKNWKIK